MNEKPFLRGHFHQAAFFLALGACSVLIAVAQTGVGRAAALIYSLSLAGLYGTSTLLHRPTWGPRMYKVMKKVDHSAIYVLIAGTATPVCLLGVDGDFGGRMLWVFWGTALLGILKELLWPHAPRWISSGFYVVMGCLPLPFLGEMARALGPQRLALTLTGGALYIAGAFIYAMRRPNPFPKVFGFHEIFHILVVAASVFHFIVVYQLVRGAV